MKVGIPGAGVVGQTLGAKLAEIGHDVVIGTRRPDALDEERGMGGTLRSWLASAGDRGKVSAFADALSTSLTSTFTGPLHAPGSRPAADEAGAGREGRSLIE